LPLRESQSLQALMVGRVIQPRPKAAHLHPAAPAVGIAAGQIHPGSAGHRARSTALLARRLGVPPFHRRGVLGILTHIFTFVRLPTCIASINLDIANSDLQHQQLHGGEVPARAVH
jgi:hypothetical protein